MIQLYGNRSVVETLEGMIRRDRIPQTILIAGPEGVGKATLVRRFAAALLGASGKLEKDDLSLPDNLALIADREKWPAEKRNDDPLLFSSHPDFITFPPDGPLRQISMPQMRVLRDRSQYKPLKGSFRVFLIDRLDRANEQAANSLLKTLEEPPAHMVLFLTAQNPYDLLPTIRSRSVLLQMAPLTEDEMGAFAAERGVSSSDRRIPLAAGCPGQVVSVDLETYDKRRAAMIALLQSASGAAAFAEWAKVAETVSSGRSDKLDSYLDVLSGLIQDLIALRYGTGTLRNPDITDELSSIARKIDFEWLRRAVSRLDELVEFLRRNIQKGIALDALVTDLRPSGNAGV